MSFLLGTTAGALVAGGVYYGFSNLVHSRTAQHQADMKVLCVRLEGADTIQPAPLSAALRIRERPFLNDIQRSWNTHVEQLFRASSTAGKSLAEWGKTTLNEVSAKKT